MVHSFFIGIGVVRHGTARTVLLRTGEDGPIAMHYYLLVPPYTLSFIHLSYSLYLYSSNHKQYYVAVLSTNTTSTTHA
jgi:hypothetical protein